VFCHWIPLGNTRATKVVRLSVSDRIRKIRWHPEKSRSPALYAVGMIRCDLDK
jgi:hypothetical protein